MHWHTPDYFTNYKYKKKTYNLKHKLLNYSLEKGVRQKLRNQLWENAKTK